MKCEISGLASLASATARGRLRVTGCFAGLALAVGGAAGSLRAASNIDPEAAFAWGANIGWVSWRPEPQWGVRIDAFVCSGFLYSANAGWIHLGDGEPENGIQYQNNSAADYGVNVEATGDLSGYAWGANIGWVIFDRAGRPRIDLRSGRLSGEAYGANVGWLRLADTNFFVRLQFLAPGADRDADALPDAWEVQHAGGLTRLRGDADSDGDGQIDLDEYRADTDPLDALDLFRITQFDLADDQRSALLRWRSRPTREYRIQMRDQFGPGAPWRDSGLGVLTGAGDITERTIPLEAGVRQRFFRIETGLPLAPADGTGP